MGRGVSTALASIGLLATGMGATACDVPVAPAILVTSTASGADATPGDGVCEVTAGGGDCTLEAAVQEGNAWGAAAITAPAGDYALADLTVTGSISINADALRPVHLSGGWIKVEAGGQLTIRGVHTGPFVTLEVRGSLAAEGVQFAALGGTVLTVEAGGAAVFRNSGLQSLSISTTHPTIENGGTVLFLHSLLDAVVLDATDTAPVLHTAPGATSTLAATILRTVSVTTPPTANKPMCGGTAPVSGGYNLSQDATCGLAGPGDVQSVDAGIVVTWAAVEDRPELSLTPGSPAIDRVPEGTLSCGVHDVEDFAAAPRPVDGDADGTSGCDAGPAERQGP